MASSFDPVARWAAETLGVADDDSAGAREAFLRRLTATGFVPTTAWRAAVTALTDKLAPSDGGVGADASQFESAAERLREEVESFAARFWSLPPPDRRRKWQVLSEWCRDSPALAARLRRLKAGLDVEADAGAHGDGRVPDLTRELKELFALWPTQAGSRRRAFLRRPPPPASEWEAAAAVIRDEMPAVAALDKTLIRELAPWRSVRRERVRRGRIEQAKNELALRPLPILLWIYGVPLVLWILVVVIDWLRQVDIFKFVGG